MADIMTYASLLEDVRKYLERGQSTDTVVYDQLPKLVNMAERRIARDLRVQGMHRVVTGSLTATVSVMDKPERWKENVSFWIGTGTVGETRKMVRNRGYDYVTQVYPDRTATGEPRFYAEMDKDHWLIAPAPDAAYPFELTYYESPPLLDDDTQTNWLTEGIPNALLYGVLLEATPFCMNDERIPTWKGFYQEAIGGTEAEDTRRMADRAATRQEV